ncbi:MAG: GDP-mannose 4,6-dehydratase [Betaproteobacteria bacterium]|nr:GDP-mannose 4,6-dehydratase [Betaproteobacteria bacterium]
MRPYANSSSLGSAPVFVLGSNGFGGSSFVKSLLEIGMDVYGYSRSPEPDARFLPYTWGHNAARFEFVQVDLNHQLDKLLRDVAAIRPRFIVNFAAQSMVGESWSNPEDWMRTNVVSLTSLIRGLTEFDFVEKYIHFTTPEVYGSTSGWKKEGFDFKPSTPYALSRAAGDWVVKLWLDNFGFPAVFTRAANIYGEGQQLYRIIPKALLFGMTGKKIPLHGGGGSIRSFIHMDDVSSALIAILAAGKIGETYHISPSESISIHDLVIEISSLLGIAPEQMYSIAGDRLGKDQAYLLDADFIRQDLGWQCNISLLDGLGRCKEWVTQNLEYFSTLETNYTHKA